MTQHQNLSIKEKNLEKIHFFFILVNFGWWQQWKFYNLTLLSLYQLCQLFTYANTYALLIAWCESMSKTQSIEAVSQFRIPGLQSRFSSAGFPCTKGCSLHQYFLLPLKWISDSITQMSRKNSLCTFLTQCQPEISVVSEEKSCCTSEHIFVSVFCYAKMAIWIGPTNF